MVSHLHVAKVTVGLVMTVIIMLLQSQIHRSCDWFLKLLLLNLKHIHCFSDGTASQYKNLTNLAHHSVDIGITAEWVFFSTSHGNSPCDGIGGTVKRLVARASLQASMTDKIFNSITFSQHPVHQQTRLEEVNTHSWWRSPTLQTS